MKRLIQLLQCPELNSLPVMNCVFQELVGAFADYDCTIKVVKSLTDVEDGGIIFLDDAAGNYINNKVMYHILGHKCPTSIFICWYWRDATFRPFQKMIYTGEHYFYLHSKSNELSDYEYMTRHEYVPLLLRANDSPNKIGAYPRTNLRDYCFMGGGYKMDWVPTIFTGLYHRVIWNNYLSYDERREIYLSSTFALGFQSDENIRTGHLSQRVFEGLAYGCVVFCENPLASAVTNGVIVHITSKDDLIEKMKFYKEHPDKIEEKQRLGYEWIKQYGTNRTSISLFLNKIKQLFKEEFESTPIVAVNVSGGLGNQLFQIAAAYAYAKKESGILQILHKQDNGDRSLYWDTLLTKIKPYLVSSIPFTIDIWNESCATMYTEIGKLTSSGKRLDGYMQTSKYFYNDTIKNEIKELFKNDLSPLLQSKYAYLLDNKERVIVVHARRTDYVKNEHMIAFHGPLDSEYYKHATTYLSACISNPIFLLCGDDPSYWNTIKDDIPIVYQHEYFLLENETDINTFTLLQQFNNVIMSNSTFIWWTTWLSNAKHVFAPAKWFGPAGPASYGDIYEEHWVRI